MTELRVSRALVGVATIWFALVASWELFGPLLAGHYASAASMGIIADNMKRWGIIAPVWVYTDKPPTPDLYYCHHPWGIFWVTRVFLWIFGRHDFVCRLPAVVWSVATVPLLGSLGRMLYRPYAGAAAALGFVVLPITLSFAHFNALEVPVMANSALFLWGMLKLRERPKKRYLLASLAGALLAVHSDWPAYVLVGLILAVEASSFFAGRERPSRRHVQWWICVTAGSAASLAFYLVVFQKAGRLGDLLASYGQRSAGNDQPLSAALEARRYWIALSFTPIAIWIGKVFAPIAAARAVVRWRREEVIPLVVLAMATVQYVVFRQGADIHVFWPHYFAEYFALACAGVVATLGAIGERAAAHPRAKRFAPVLRRSGPIALGALACALAMVLRDGVVALAWARASGGRFNEKGLRIESDGDEIATLRWLASRERRIGLHASVGATWSHVWSFGGRVVPLAAAPPLRGTKGVTVVDTRFVNDAARAGFIQNNGVTQIGSLWVLDGGTHDPTVFALREREPSLLEWYFQSGTEPVRDVVPDPWAEWELRSAYALDDVPVPDGLAAPSGELEARRVRYDAAMKAGDLETAAAEMDAINAICPPIDAEFSDGSRIHCALYQPGASPLLRVLIEAHGPLDEGVELRVTSRVVEPLPFTTTMTDPTERDLSFPFSLSPRRWRRGWLYEHAVRLLPRPGTEVFEASFTGPRAPTRGRPVEILRL
ncbi:MAG: glycosyltransferase family 39 protein [Polyangiaceae bacterium]